MSSQVELVAIITPAPGKIDQVIEELTILNKHVEDNEPDVLRYQMYKQVNVKDGAEVLVYIEVYKNQEVFDKHRTSEVHAAIQKGAESKLLAAPPDIKILQHVGGFASR